MRGAVPATAIERSTRPVEYRPEFIDDATAEMRTTFMMSAMRTPPTWKPTRSSTVTKGDSPCLYCAVGRRKHRSVMVPT